MGLLDAVGAEMFSHGRSWIAIPLQVTSNTPHDQAPRSHRCGFKSRYPPGEVSWVAQAVQDNLGIKEIRADCFQSKPEVFEAITLSGTIVGPVRFGQQKSALPQSAEAQYNSFGIRAYCRRRRREGSTAR